MKNYDLERFELVCVAALIIIVILASYLLHVKHQCILLGYSDFINDGFNFYCTKVIGGATQLLPIK